MGSVFSAIGRGINAVISAIAGVIMAIVGAITTVIVTIFDVIPPATAFSFFLFLVLIHVYVCPTLFLVLRVASGLIPPSPSVTFAYGFRRVQPVPASRHFPTRTSPPPLPAAP
ncbi:hypothetical protein DFH09DRAFT_1366471 [Mycena vulgaris]|nr:hypothetical protein DFH09DRAFT_1366471 [Mycena vulgaris]